MADPNSNNLSAKTIINRFWNDYIKPKKSLVILCLSLLALVAVSYAFYPALIGFVFDALEAKNTNLLFQLAGLIVLISIVKAFAVYRQIQVVNKLVFSIIEEIQYKMTSKLIEADLSLITSQPPGHFVSRIVNDLNLIRDALVRVANSFVKDSLTLIAMICLMCWYDWFLAFLVLCVFPIAIYPIIRIGLDQRKASYNLQNHMENLISQLSETISNIPVIKAYNLEINQKERSKYNFNQLFLRLMKLNVGRARVEPILEILGGIAISVVIVSGAWRLGKVDFSVGDFAGFITAMLLMVQPARGLGSFNSVVQEGIAAANRIYQLIDQKPIVISSKSSCLISSGNEIIQFDNVSFKYGKIDVLKNISFNAEKGKVTAIVGASGAGKTTLLGLIERFYNVSQGAIYLGNQDLKDIKISSLRSKIAYVSQEGSMFNDTIKNNIMFGNQDADFGQVKKAAQNAAAHDFIQSLPDGYETQIGTGGNLLSGGQRQRIAIARAFLRDAPILLLDEATSSLDSESESKIQYAMDKLAKGRTTIVVAHRLSTVRKANKIIVLDNGKIVESGSHENLIAKDGVYTNLCRLQLFSG
ncbi:MAG: ABC transporter ATP-binding protein [Candidatus Puniceispirillales bacterium]